MKRILPVAAMLALISACPAVSPAVSNENAVTPNLSQEKKQYEQRMEERLGKIGKQLDEVKTRTATVTEQTRKEMNQYLDDAEKKQKAASLKLEKIRKESTRKWKKFTSDMDAAMDDFEKAYERAKSRFKE